MTVSMIKMGSRMIVRSALVAMVASATVLASAQNPRGFSMGASYTYVRSNVLPGCACISLNGGSAELQYGLIQHMALFGDFAAVHKSGITQDNYALTQYTYTGGIRYLPNHATAKLQPFAEAAVGGANVTGTLSPAQTGFGSAHAFALQTGGGLELRINRRFAVVPAHVDYMLTTFANGAQSRQNDLRISGGVRLRLDHGR